MRRAPGFRAAALAALAVLGCTNGGLDRVTNIVATGQVVGFLAVDANGSRLLDQGDDSLPGIKVRLVVSGSQDTGLVETTQSNGFYRFRDVPVGKYSLKVDISSFSDTLQLIKVDSAAFTVLPADTVHVNALAGLPLVTVSQARALPVGRRVFVTGVALSRASSFADTTSSLADTSGAITLVRARASFAAGDSLRVRATAGRRLGQPTLNDATVYPLGQGVVPTAALLTTQVAAGAAGASRDAQLVQVSGAIISDTARTATSFVLTVSDGSGPLEVQLDRTADASFQPAALPADYVPGNKFDVLGVLAATGAGTWRLRPRTAADLTEIPPQVVSIAAARAVAPGQAVVVVGVALNASGTFSDSTVHLVDTSAAIRLTRLRAIVAAGDSIKVRATTASRNGQPTLDAGTVTRLGQGLFPTAAVLTTQQAAGAAGGTRDAQMIVVHNATISDTTRVLGDYRLTVSDGSGNLVVQLDQVAPFVVPGVYVPGNAFDIVGLLAPTGTGSWILKPRSGSDLRRR